MKKKMVDVKEKPDFLTKDEWRFYQKNNPKKIEKEVMKIKDQLISVDKKEYEKSVKQFAYQVFLKETGSKNIENETERCKLWKEWSEYAIKHNPSILAYKKTKKLIAASENDNRLECWLHIDRMIYSPLSVVDKKCLDCIKSLMSQKCSSKNKKNLKETSFSLTMFVNHFEAEDKNLLIEKDISVHSSSDKRFRNLKCSENCFFFCDHFKIVAMIDKNDRLKILDSQYASVLDNAIRFLPSDTCPSSM
jgi:hypothetical protein